MVHLRTIKRSNYFKTIYESGKKFRYNYVGTVIIFKNNTNISYNNTLNYAVVIGKKIVSQAVTRNRIKRLLRETLRQLSKKYKDKIIYIDKIILSYNMAPKHLKLIKLQEIMPAVEIILKQAFFYYENKYLKNNITYSENNSDYSDQSI